MYTDVVVLAGVGTVGLMIAFMVGLAYVFVKDAKKRSKVSHK
ncbi:cytochrome c oxidase subunit CcoM [Alkalimarinus sediminis]|nr:cytochrome c oxidase subunit CcoM [Alkalimarinus sediminis]